MKKNSARKRPSSEDVARRAGVSRATVSAYINGTRYVSPALGRKIERAIRALGYTPDPAARALKMKDAKTIALIIPVMSRFFAPIMKAVNEMAHRHGYGFLLSSSEEDAARERDVLRILVAKRISGILIVPCSAGNASFISAVVKDGTPVVQVNRKIPGLDTDSVVSDTFRAVFDATDYLAGRGRKKIAFLGYDENTLAGVKKKAGYEAGLAKHGIGERLVIAVKEHDDEDISRSLSLFLDSHRDTDGLICTTQGKTAVALRVLKDRGARIPDGISVIGFDDSPWSGLTDPPLTVISENTYRMGEIAAGVLLERIEKRKDGGPSETILEDEFIVRAST
jgi:DNA-binding LacI/PurR family transcriptional regulator